MLRLCETQRIKQDGKPAAEKKSVSSIVKSARPYAAKKPLRSICARWGSSQRLPTQNSETQVGWLDGRTKKATEEGGLGRGPCRQRMGPEQEGGGPCILIQQKEDRAREMTSRCRKFLGSRSGKGLTETAPPKPLF